MNHLPGLTLLLIPTGSYKTGLRGRRYIMNLAETKVEPVK